MVGCSAPKLADWCFGVTYEGLKPGLVSEIPGASPVLELPMRV